MVPSNTASGFQALLNATAPVQNTILGMSAGTGYTTTESNNIIIRIQRGRYCWRMNVCRVGLSTGTGSGQLNQTFIADTLESRQ